MRKALVTGGFGFLGRHVAKKLNLNGYQVYGIGHGSWGAEVFKKYGFGEWVCSEITINSLNLLNNKFDLIVHCSGSASVPLSWEKPSLDFEKTVLSTQAVLEFALRNMPDCKIIYPSSAAVYGESLDSEISENSNGTPVSPYGFNKRIAEEICENYENCFDLNITVIRFFSLYGPGLKKQILWDACNKFYQNAGKVEFFGTGMESRDFLYIDDAVDLIFIASQNIDGFNIYNGGSGKAINILEAVEKISKLLKTDKTFYFCDKSRKGDPKSFCANIDRAKTLGWEPKISFDQGIEKYVNWFKYEKN